MRKVKHAISGYLQVKGNQLSLNFFPNPLSPGAGIQICQESSFDYADEDNLEDGSRAYKESGSPNCVNMQSNPASLALKSEKQTSPIFIQLLYLYPDLYIYSQLCHKTASVIK